MVGITRTALGSVLLISIVLPCTVSSSPVFETYSYDSVPAEETGVGEAEPWSETEARNAKRHSDGTFTSDYSKYLDTEKAKDFVHWLIGTKRSQSKPARAPERPQTEVRRHAEGTIASDYSSVLDGQAAKDFVNWLVRNRGRGKRELVSEQDAMLDSASLGGTEEEEEEEGGAFPRENPESAELGFILEQLSTQQLMRLLQNGGGPCEPTSRGAFAD